jgi:hypothetical protein
MGSPFEQARARFRNEVATTFDQKPARLQIIPQSGEVIGFDDFKTGDLIAFEATARAPNLRVRGLASGSTVVLLESNHLGPLFRAANALDASKAMAALDLARRVTWLMGPGYKLVEQVSDYPAYPLPSPVAPPSLDRAGGGATLHFYYLQYDANGGPATKLAAEIKCSARYEAALVTSPGP